jgi:NADPH-dependent 2,4-dienoyl-CoA reductase/sulfur reductase-like enzyme
MIKTAIIVVLIASTIHLLISGRLTRMLSSTALQQASSRVKHTVVVGGGLAGLSAAIEASRAGAHVTLLDKVIERNSHH